MLEILVLMGVMALVWIHEELKSIRRNVESDLYKIQYDLQIMSERAKYEKGSNDFVDWLEKDIPKILDNSEESNELQDS